MCLATLNGHSETAGYLEDAMGPIGALAAKLNFARYRDEGRNSNVTEAFEVAEQKIRGNVADINYRNKGDEGTQLYAPLAPLVPTSKTESRNSSLHCLKREQIHPEKLDVLGLLVAAGANVNARNNQGMTPLHRVCSHYTERGADLITFLLGNGAMAELNTQGGSDGRTALLCAVSSGNEGVAKVLLDAGARPDARDEGGNTALHLVCDPSYYTCVRNVHRVDKLVELLLGHGVSVNVQNSSGDTPLLIALGRRFYRLAGLFLKRAPDIETHQVNARGENALTMAALGGHLELVELFLLRGASAVGQCGEKALGGACSDKNLSIIYVLLHSRVGELGRLA
ncbi:repeat domain-containing protein 61 [Seminavis robusta]|uniref:Repeat domain-containing protein 61 n=1 Tax=Seminavis robusta TaxID=568900 RepID=A0A9N8HX45_9STRA|nr:repeat domain-containing protein 61 [Seminavis robusta]|eukprot:Sro2357_g324610.1 repeat domain-containing protein 61 (340) ;mRNA; r:9519-10708